MMLDRALLVRYLRQRRELGEAELLLEDLTAAELVALLRAGRAAESRGGGGAALLREALGIAPAPVAPGRAAAPAAASGYRVDAAVPWGAGQGSGGAELRVLTEEAMGCTRCRLHEGRNSVVFGEGSPTAELLVVGEAPGMEEDRTGRPFVGRAGKLLDLLLASAGFPREEVYICNVLKCRPPNNRDPLHREVEQCSSFLHRQIEMISPRVILAAGKFAVQTLLGTDEAISKLRGRVHAYRGVPLIATFHPAFLLRSPRWSRAAWLDLQLLRELLDEAA